MSLGGELSELTRYLREAYDAIEAKGGTTPEHKNADGLATAIDSISISND